jgi:L-seryl-tRNA(Ser) seleniumtransferase
MTLAALEATLMLYRDQRDALQKIPTLRMLALTQQELRAKAERLLTLMRDAEIQASLVEAASQVGGGALPTQDLPTWCVALDFTELSAQTIENRLRQGNPAIIGRIVKDRFLLDARTLEEKEFLIIIQQVKQLLF